MTHLSNEASLICLHDASNKQQLAIFQILKSMCFHFFCLKIYNSNVNTISQWFSIWKSRLEKVRITRLSDAPKLRCDPHLSLNKHGYSSTKLPDYAAAFAALQKRLQTLCTSPSEPAKTSASQGHQSHKGVCSITKPIAIHWWLCSLIQPLRIWLNCSNILWNLHE